jgi:AcrR family transcriptional regulator
MGLRELKKEQTRQLIADTAWRLFADRGFDRVTVAEIAREAQVAEATVFNYFPTKEDLFYWRLEAFGTRLADAVSARSAGEPVLAAFRRALMDEGGLLTQVEAGDPEALARLRTVNRVIADSPALLAREQQAITRNAAAVAALLAAEAATLAATGTRAGTGTPAATGTRAGTGTPAATGTRAGSGTSAEAGTPADDLRPQVAANALLGMHRALIDYVRRRVLADDEPRGLAADIRRLTTEAFTLLEHGLRDYAAKPSAPAASPR